MEFSIGTQFSREFSFEDTLIADDLKNTLNKYFDEKKYDAKTQKIYCSFICVSKGFEPFFMVRPLKIYRTEPAIEYEIKIEFEPFFKSNNEERSKILSSEFLKWSKEILNDKKMKNFDVEEFVSDLERCLSSVK
ncbi:hypothetical protein [Flavobacterium branchiicola]|uniref:Immunity protein 44 of polymorphic toxin system n=1 Tax=Flavobacterium branchiicola TaxID=1114875 RepID=A0ABV9PAL7_9FLAO|nr:hypothetical protein [Flavobacterium branchiicola]MBS7252451.1 hypothetical protein [Flavobacterium branchiicola]